MQNGIPVGLRSSPSFGLSRSGQLTAIIQSLFWDGSQGWWYDDNDTTTLFQDSAGTTPVTAVEQFVGLQLDKSKGGVGTNGTRRVNLLTYTEQFDNAAWTKVAATVTQNATTAPDGTATADKLIATVASSAHCITQNGLTVNSEGKFLLYAKSGEYTRVGFRESQTTGNWVVFDLNAGTVLGSSGMTGATISPAGNGWYLCSATQPNTATQGMGIHIVDSGWTSGSPNNRLFSGNGVDGIFIWGADLRLAADANVSPTYQRITDTWYNTLPGNHRYAPASGNRPIWSKRVNLLTKTEQFDDAYWTKTGLRAFGSGSVANATTAPDGTVTADFICEDTSNGVHGVAIPYNTGALWGSMIPGLAYRCSVFVKPSTRTKFSLFLDSYGGTGSASVNVTLTGNGSIDSQSNVTNPTIALAEQGFYRVSFTMTSNSILGGLFCNMRNDAGNTSYVGDGTSGLFIWGADLRPANQATGLLPLYQRVNTSSDYDTNGFPGYLKADGVDDFLQTNSIDFSAGPTNPPLGPELVTNGDFTSGTTGWTVTSGGATIAAVSGELRISGQTSSPTSVVQNISTVAGKTYRATATYRMAGSGGTLVRFDFGINGTNNSTSTNITSTVVFTATSTLTALSLLCYGVSTTEAYFDNISVKEITNANLGANKITLCAGVRKLSDAAQAVVTELSTSIANPGSFAFYAPSAAGTDLSFFSGGTTFRGATQSGFASPITAVASGIGNISGDSAILRVNGTQVASNTGDQGTGNYGNYVTYFFSRGGSGLRFNGNEYGNIAVGKLLTADQLTALETYMNGLTKAY